MCNSADWIEVTNPDGTKELFLYREGTLVERNWCQDGQKIAPGQTWLLPAAMEEWTLTPETILAGILCTLPLAA